MAGFDWDANHSAFGVCPLCRRGEAGSEHLGVWCRAVVAAWVLSRHPDTRCSILTALGGATADSKVATAVLHQAVFLTSALMGRSSMAWLDAAQWIARAV
eukprot:11941216-Heterocapsa_arctica.AAC.1